MSKLAAGCLVVTALAHAPLASHADGAPRLFEWVGMYGAASGNVDADVGTAAGYAPVPFLWRYDPLIDGVPSPRARNTYAWQQSGATAVPRSGWRAFFVFADAATIVGGLPADAQDVARTLTWLQAQNEPLDYVFADLEGWGTAGDWSNIHALIDQVRGSSAGAGAAIGNFGWFPGPVNLGADYPASADQRLQNTDYALSASGGAAGLGVAMPSAYPLSAYELHADDTGSWGAGWWSNTGLPNSSLAALTANQRAAVGSPYLSPNERAAMFYAPLEQVSLAKRNLPAGHQLIPWVSTFQASMGVPAPHPGQLPTLRDNEALLEHLRLRGADGYYAFASDGTQAYAGTYSDGSSYSIPAYHVYTADMAATWHSLDWFFGLPTQVGAVTADGPLNLLTFKNTGGTYADPAGRNGGIEWSAFQRGNRILALISNLGNGTQAAGGSGNGNNGNWQRVFQAIDSRLPAVSPQVAAGQHLLVQYLSNPAVTDFNAYPPGTVLGSAQGWHVGAASFVVGSAAGRGLGANRVVSIVGGAAAAWVANAATANPGGIGATDNDTMVYSFDVFTGWAGAGNASFAPAVGFGTQVPLPAPQNGPTLWVFAGGTGNYWAFGSGDAAGGRYRATNFAPAPSTWYHVQMIVDPATDRATVYVGDLTRGDGIWHPLQFVDTRPPGGGASSSVPAGLIAGAQDPSRYDAFQISGSAGAQFDGLTAQLFLYPTVRTSVLLHADERPQP